MSISIKLYHASSGSILTVHDIHDFKTSKLSELEIGIVFYRNNDSATIASGIGILTVTTVYRDLVINPTLSIEQQYIPVGDSVTQFVNIWMDAMMELIKQYETSSYSNISVQLKFNHKSQMDENPFIFLSQLKPDTIYTLKAYYRMDDMYIGQGTVDVKVTWIDNSLTTLHIIDISFQSMIEEHKGKYTIDNLTVVLKDKLKLIVGPDVKISSAINNIEGQEFTMTNSIIPSDSNLIVRIKANRSIVNDDFENAPLLTVDDLHIGWMDNIRYLGVTIHWYRISDNTLVAVATSCFTRMIGDELTYDPINQVTYIDDSISYDILLQQWNIAAEGYIHEYTNPSISTYLESNPNSNQKAILTPDGIPVETAVQYSRIADLEKAGIPVTEMDKWFEQVIDKGTIPFSNIITQAYPYFQMISEVHMKSGSKYPKYLWRENPKEIYVNCKDALLRHSIYLMQQEHIDPESDIPHIWQLMCRIHMALTCYVFAYGRSEIIDNWVDDEYTSMISNKWITYITYPTLGTFANLIRNNILHRDTLVYIPDDSSVDKWIANIGHNVYNNILVLCELSVGEYRDEEFNMLIQLFTQISKYANTLLAYNQYDLDYPFKKS